MLTYLNRSHGWQGDVAVENGAQSGDAIRLLLVEDTPADAATLMALLARSTAPPIQVEHVVSLERASDFLDRHEVDLIVLDLGLPDAQGLEGVELLAARYAGTPFVVLTGIDDDNLALTAIHAGAQDFVVKGSIDRHALLRMFRYAIERHRNQKELALLSHELKMANANLAKLSIIDPLTELLNRRGLQQRLNGELERLSEGDACALVLLIDLDDFKRINDSLGHAAGDVALREVAQKIRSAVRAIDIVARIGGDEFMILLPNSDPTQAVRIAERIRLKVASVTLQSDPEVLSVTASIGALMLTLDTPSIDELLIRAQQVLQRSKSTGKNRVSYSGAEFDDTAQRMAAQADMVTALTFGRRLYSAEQSIVDLNSGEIVGYEYLSRYGNPPMAMPENFFRISAEKNALTLVDHQCMRSAIEKSLKIPLHLSRHINLFPSTLLAIPTEHLLAELPTDVDPGVFCIEISESQIIGDPSYLLEPVRGLRAAGVKVAIDDVGFGNSCLESLVYLEPEIIKLDKRCGKGIGDDAAKAAYLKRYLRILFDLTDHVILEGIETERDAAVARDLGVPFGQGYFWGVPTIDAAIERRSV
jgi:diguanylate cyclase (GGDEF)-like protein